MAVTITSYAIDNNATRPYVTLPHYKEQGDQLIKVTGVQYSSFCPLVSEDKREAWEAWSVANQGWIPAQYDTQKSGDNSSLITPFIYQNDASGNPIEADVLPSGQFHGPIWELAPVLTFFVNYDLLSDKSINAVFEETQQVRDVAQSGIEGITKDFNATDRFTWPSLYLVGPIFDSFVQDSNMVAILSTVVHLHFFRESSPGRYRRHVCCGQDYLWRCCDL